MLKRWHSSSTGRWCCIHQAVHRRIDLQAWMHTRPVLSTPSWPKSVSLLKHMDTIFRRFCTNWCVGRLVQLRRPTQHWRNFVGPENLNILVFLSRMPRLWGGLQRFGGASSFFLRANNDYTLKFHRSRLRRYLLFKSSIHPGWPTLNAVSMLRLWPFDFTHVGIDGVLATARELGITIVAYSPLGRGFLTGRFKKLDDLDSNDGRRQHPRFSEENWNNNFKVRANFVPYGWWLMTGADSRGVTSPRGQERNHSRTTCSGLGRSTGGWYNSYPRSVPLYRCSSSWLQENRHQINSTPGWELEIARGRLLPGWIEGDAGSNKLCEHTGPTVCLFCCPVWVDTSRSIYRYPPDRMKAVEQ